MPAPLSHGLMTIWQFFCSFTKAARAFFHLSVGSQFFHIFLLHFSTTENKIKTLLKCFASLVANAFLSVHFSTFWFKNGFLGLNRLYYWQRMGTQNANFVHFFFILLLLWTKNQILLPWLTELFLTVCFFSILN
jgi:hypothetical protein